MNIFNGIYQLITSPSGIFSLISLAVLTVLSWHLGVAWVTAAAAAWAAFFAIIPAALGYFEHREQLYQWQNNIPQGPTAPLPPSPVLPTSPGLPVNSPPTTVTVSMPSERNLPPRGTL
jgi:hypothetical protein